MRELIVLRVNRFSIVRLAVRRQGSAFGLHHDCAWLRQRPGFQEFTLGKLRAERLS